MSENFGTAQRCHFDIDCDSAATKNSENLLEEWWLQKGKKDPLEVAAVASQKCNKN